MKYRPNEVLACVLLVCLPMATAETAILQLQVVEGEGAVHSAGVRSARPVTVQVTDETGRPVEGVAVSFRLPDEQVTGLFASGLRTEIVISAADGRAAVWGIQWGPAPGPVRLRVTAAKDQARAGIVVNQYVSESVVVTETPAGGEVSRGGGSGKWKWLLIAAGAVGGGVAAGMARGRSSASSAPSVGAVTTPPVQVGPPTITVGKP